MSNHYAFDGRAPSAPAIKQMIELADRDAATASLAVHSDDDMFAFSVGITGAAAIGAMAYFRAGLSINDTILKIVNWRFGDAGRLESFLDFAAGYGRSTRFLVQHVPSKKVSVAEIQQDSLTFQAAEFGVNTLLSRTNPEELTVDRQYDVVFVASLFTHLPEKTFGLWLAKLWEFVAPGGILVYSVHDEAINDIGATLTDGFVFISSTEVASLSTEDYGTNFTTEDFVRRQIRESVGDDEAARAIRLPRALCFMQDIWVMCRGEVPATSLAYECGPQGALDELVLAPGSVRLSGWAADRGYSRSEQDSHAIAEVSIYVNGVLEGQTTMGKYRPDVSKHLGLPSDPLLSASGWETTISGRALKQCDVVVVMATCENGAAFVLDSTRVSDILARSRPFRSRPIGRRASRRLARWRVTAVPGPCLVRCWWSPGAQWRSWGTELPGR